MSMSMSMSMSMNMKKRLTSIILKFGMAGGCKDSIFPQ